MADYYSDGPTKWTPYYTRFSSPVSLSYDLCSIYIFSFFLLPCCVQCKVVWHVVPLLADDFSRALQMIFFVHKLFSGLSFPLLVGRWSVLYEDPYILYTCNIYVKKFISIKRMRGYECIEAALLVWFYVQWELKGMLPYTKRKSYVLLQH